MKDDRIQCVCGARYFPAQGWAHRGCAVKYGVANGTVANGLANANALELEPVVKTARAGRYADGEKRKAYMRELMRKRRAEGKA